MSDLTSRSCGTLRATARSLAIMTIHHQSHSERIDARLGFEWDKLPPFLHRVDEIPLATTQVRFRRVGKSHRGIRNLKGLESLWAYGVDQDFLEEICSLHTLRLLYIEKVTAIDLSVISTLPSLGSLSVIGATKINNLSWIPTHQSLRSLAIENLKHVHDLTPLSQLTQLKALAVEGSMWSPMQVLSLSPLSVLGLLEFLFITNLRVEDQSLRPLHNLQKLRALQCARFFPHDEFRCLAQARPQLRCDWFDDSHWGRAS